MVGVTRSWWVTTTSHVGPARRLRQGLAARHPGQQSREVVHAAEVSEHEAARPTRRDPPARTAASPSFDRWPRVARRCAPSWARAYGLDPQQVRRVVRLHHQQAALRETARPQGGRRQRPDVGREPDAPRRRLDVEGHRLGSVVRHRKRNESQAAQIDRRVRRQRAPVDLVTRRPFLADGGGRVGAYSVTVRQHSAGRAYGRRGRA